MIGCVVTACGIPQKVIDTFISANKFQDKGINLYMTSHIGDNVVAPGVKVSEIEPQAVFNIGYSSNVSIREAIKQCDIIIKTDIDCMLSDECLEQIKETEPLVGFSYRHWNINDLNDLPGAKLDSRTMGTISLSSLDWRWLMGYDERLSGYGYDDYHMLSRAKREYIKIETVSDPKVYHINHGDKHNRSTINPLLRSNNIEASVGNWTKLKASESWGCIL